MYMKNYVTQEEIIKLFINVSTLTWLLLKSRQNNGIIFHDQNHGLVKNIQNYSAEKCATNYCHVCIENSS